MSRQMTTDGQVLTAKGIWLRSINAINQFQQGVPVMKKILALTILLVAAAACSTGPATNQPAANTNSATATAAKSPPTVSEADITAKEKATWEAIKKKDYDGFGEMLASDYLEVGGEGVFDKKGIIGTVKDL